MVANGFSTSVHYDIVKADTSNATSHNHLSNRLDFNMANGVYCGNIVNGVNHGMTAGDSTLPAMMQKGAALLHPGSAARGVAEGHYANAATIMMNGQSMRSPVTHDVIRHSNGDFSTTGNAEEQQTHSHTNSDVILCSNRADIVSSDVIRPSNICSGGLQHTNDYVSPSTNLHRPLQVSANHNDPIDNSTNQVAMQSVSANHNSSIPATSNQNELMNQSSDDRVTKVSYDDLLREAAAAGHIDNVIALLSKGAQVTPDQEGRTALHLACAVGHVTTTALLLSTGCNVNMPEKTGHVALQLAAAEGHADVVQQLLQRGADVNVQDNTNGNTALHEAAWQGFSGTVKLLLDAGASMVVRNRGGFTALHLACQNGHNQTCRTLLLAGCDPDIRNSYGDTPLHTSARYGHAGVMRILISGEANVCEQNKNGDSALHIAAAMGRRKLTRILLEGGVDSHLKNKQAESALDIATRKQHTDIVSLISQPPPVSKSAAARRRVQQQQQQQRHGAAARLVDSGSSGRDDAARASDTQKKKPARVHFESGAKPDRKRQQRCDAPRADDIAEGVGWSPYGCFSPPDVTDFPQPRLETLPREPLRKGEQYYLDLAGNIRKGPVGEGYTCYCAPFFQQVETKLERDKRELLAHIDGNHSRLDRKIEQLERRTRCQLAGLGDAVRGRLSRERLECCERAKRAALRTQTELEQRQRAHVRAAKDDLTAYLDGRLERLSVRGAAAGASRRRQLVATAAAVAGDSGVTRGAAVKLTPYSLHKSRSAEVLTDLSDGDDGYPQTRASPAAAGGALRVLSNRPATANKMVSAAAGAGVCQGGTAAPSSAVQHVGYMLRPSVSMAALQSHYSHPASASAAAATATSGAAMTHLERKRRQLARHSATTTAIAPATATATNSHNYRSDLSSHTIVLPAEAPLLPSHALNGSTELPGRHQRSMSVALVGDSSASDDSHYVAMTRLSGAAVAATNTSLCQRLRPMTEPSSSVSSAAAAAAAAAVGAPVHAHRQFQPLDSHEEGSDQHNDSGYSTRIYTASSSQGASPALSGVPTEEDSISTGAQSGVMPVTSSRSRAHPLANHLNCIAEDIVPRQPIGLKSSLV